MRGGSLGSSPRALHSGSLSVSVARGNTATGTGATPKHAHWLLCMPDVCAVARSTHAPGALRLSELEPKVCVQGGHAAAVGVN